MAHFDLFNGDADGIFALLQLRKHRPLKSQLITGVKRDIALLSRCHASGGDSVTVLDVSMEKNMAALEQLLLQKVEVFYADHHRAGEYPTDENLEAHIDLSADTCTSLIIDNYLNGQFHTWAIAGAFGDNLIKQANDLCEKAKLSHAERDFLYELGTLVNYNGYGENLSDLHFDPKDLYLLLAKYDSPFDLKKDNSSPFFQLKHLYEKDMLSAQKIEVFYSDAVLNVFILPNEAFSRRISGVYGNHLANANPDKAHLVLSLNKTGDHTVSLRAPLNNKQGADIICSAFATGGGRAGAAGINQLAKEEIKKLIILTSQYYMQ